MDKRWDEEISFVRPKQRKFLISVMTYSFVSIGKWYSALTIDIIINKQAVKVSLNATNFSGLSGAVETHKRY